MSNENTDQEKPTQESTPSKQLIVFFQVKSMTKGVAGKGSFAQKQYKVVPMSRKFSGATPVNAAIASIKQEFGEPEGDGVRTINTRHKFAEIISWKYTQGENNP